jgi:hypothetical protein
MASVIGATTTTAVGPEWQAACDRARIVAEEARCRKAAGTTVDSDWLAEAAAWLAEAAPTWVPLTGRVPTRRTWRDLTLSADLQVRLQCWPPGSGLSFHDHGGAAGAVVVLDGRLEEAFAPRPEEAVTRRLLPAGSTSAFGPEYVHAMANLDAAVVTTINVYAPIPPQSRWYRLRPDGTIVPVGSWSAKLLPRHHRRAPLPRR